MVTNSIGQSRTLTSTNTYGDGIEHILSLSLSRSQRVLILTTDKERTTRGLQFIPTSAVNNFTEIFVGGVTQELGMELGVSNLTGCIGFSSVAMIDPVPLVCTTGSVSGSCSTCSNEVNIIIDDHNVWSAGHACACNSLYRHNISNVPARNISNCVNDIIIILTFQQATL